MVAKRCAGGRSDVARSEPASGPRHTQRNPLRRPVGHEDLADEVVLGHGAPHARVARLRAIVTHDEVAAGGHAVGVLGADVAAIVLDVRLLEPLSVDVDECRTTSQANRDPLAREPDDPLHERASRSALRLRRRRRLEDDHVSALRIAEVVDEAIREHAVREARLAPRCGARAVECRLHRRRRDAVRIHDPRLDGEDDRDRADDRDDPVDGDPQPARKASGDAIEGVMELVVLVRVVGRRRRQRPRERGRRRRWRPVLARHPPLVGLLREALFGVAHETLLTCSRLQVSIRPWSPERRISGTVQPRNSAGRV